MAWQHVKWVVSQAVIIPSVLLLIVSLIVWGIADKQSALAVLEGGSIAIMPQLGVMLMLFFHAKPLPAAKFIKQFYRAEVYKFMLSALLLVLAFKWGVAKPLLMLVSYVSLHLLVGFVPLFFKQA